MPPQLSKCIYISCKEFSHPWGDSCTSATTGLGLHALQECLRIYSTVYVVALLMKGKVPSKGDVKKTILGILQSTAFLSWSAFSYSMFICTLRRVLGNFNVLSVSFLPSFLSSLSAIFIERPSRRTLLCLYVSNIVSRLGGIEVFNYAICAQLAINLFFDIKKIIKKPLLIKSVIFKKGNLNLAVFLGGFAGLYRVLSNTIALYFMWKALQLLWNDLAEKKIVPEVKGFAIFLYCFSTAVLFHVAILEPQFLRSSYWKFLYAISGGRVAVMSRIPLDAFGLESTKHLADVLRKTNTTDKRNYVF
ncbi:Transmembrane protein 135 [Habropoda laboriosa]|uniref:Transmembrane protein 135 n=1 Tax=Habropoda laboriosa TaxID=597456 RepID=A0A0L7QQT8_9HYME|nr:Transmembrane protein 135 [Habropoda laboriosa]